MIIILIITASWRFVKISFSQCRILISLQVLKKANIVQKKKTTEHTRTERQVFRHNQILWSMKPITRRMRRTESEHATREPISNAFPEILILLLLTIDRKWIQVLETIRQSPFLVTMHYAFQTPAKLHLVLGEWTLGQHVADVMFDDVLADYVSGGELFTHLYQREKFKESEVRIYTAEIILALQHLHKVRSWLDRDV